MRASIAVGGVALIAAVAFTGVWTATSAQAASSDATVNAPHALVETNAPKPLTAVLMGDSYTAGNGARAGRQSLVLRSRPSACGAPTRGASNTREFSTTRGYAVTLMNRACSAATTDAVLHPRNMKDTRVIAYPPARGPVRASGRQVLHLLGRVKPSMLSDAGFGGVLRQRTSRGRPSATGPTACQSCATAGSRPRLTRSTRTWTWCFSRLAETTRTFLTS